MNMQKRGDGVFETIINRIYSKILKHGDTCLDGGAHTGLAYDADGRIGGPIR